MGVRGSNPLSSTRKLHFSGASSSTCRPAIIMTAAVVMLCLQRADHGNAGFGRCGSATASGA